MKSFDFEERMMEYTKAITVILEQYLPKSTGCQKTVLEAMNYSILAGGKRLRPILMLAVFLMCGGKEKDRRLLEPFMAAIEMIHTYSLVHDDLPSMDNDEYRRGQRTTWAVYGEDIGVLAGDGLLNYAFETVADAFRKCETITEYTRVTQAFGILSGNAGVYGMIGGQTADVEAESMQTDMTEELLLFIHEHKTAKLIEAAMTIGGVLAGADSDIIERLKKCAYNIGIAFQIQDDILDVVGNSEVLGKPIGSDRENHKQTYVTLKGLDRAKEDVKTLSEEAVEILESFGSEHVFLKQLVLELIHRQK